ncbi:uncharacterized protein A1O9_02344 [Exophiala aquamarina CBS 119918]|uniref:PHD-type domain-containing protein n=1 Tax=Exophiala aquamarina CBS 119918 TaxID=1182545 RepID=A0A072PM48_9EURO|nr:uncharacterized protein A1O9_02344 [Exophiala aquamarina CBS 119918]KEF60782.1 hypothetical protein A1O9_02344 [Exophiala aquamarina CBS 119918]
MSSVHQIGSNAVAGADGTDLKPDNLCVVDSVMSLDPLHGHLTNLPVTQFDSEHPLPTGPRRGSFSEFLPHRHTLPHPIHSIPPAPRSDPLNPSSGEPGLPTLKVDEHQTDSNPDESLGPSGRMGTELDIVGSPDGATIDVATEAPVGSVPTRNVQTQQQSSRRNKHYTLSDGSIVSGKGLGRGRPGIKRGPVNPWHQMAQDSVYPKNSSTDAAGLLTNDTTVPIKRRRLGSGPSNPNMSVTSSPSISLDSRESSIEYKASATHTRSGRQTQKPVNLATKAVTASPVSKTTSSNSPANVTPSSVLKSHPKIKRRVYRGREQFALCEHCLRGHGPSGNVIVFCDACNKCWHQRCHEPQISRQTVSDSKAEWFCADCDRILHGKKGKKQENKTPTSAKAPASLPPAPTFIYGGPRVGGRLLSPEQKYSYLNSLSKEQLIALLLDGSHLAPDLPIFETLVPVLPPNGTPGAQFTSTYVTPVSKAPESADAGGAKGNDGLDEGYDGYYDEHAALYPKPGFGVQLPPEREDLHMLLEAKGSKTFSHWVRGMRGNQFSGTGNVPGT